MRVSEMQKTALITGITGQDGSHLAEFLLDKGYRVFGLKRRTSTTNTQRISRVLGDVSILDGDMLDFASLEKAVKAAQPAEVYHLAAQSFVGTSFVQPELTGNVIALGAARILEAVRMHAPAARFYNASTSEQFGSAPPPQSEKTPFHPMSPYGCAKLYAHMLTQNYREAYGLFACSGILYNHEGPRRGAEFVTQKIARAAASIKKGLSKELRLGNLEAKRDWGHARDFVEAMWLMLQQDKPDDYVVATGEAHSVREFVKLAFDRLGLDYLEYVKIDEKLFRPAEVDYLLGDASKARKALGWFPKTTFSSLVEEMVDAAMKSDLTREGA
jgi:GDPmannose 4,6-dehydratase